MSRPSARAPVSGPRDPGRRAARAACRACGRVGLDLVLDLGLMPPSDLLVDADGLDRAEPRFPLELAFCPGCSLAQILETVDPRLLFSEGYRYFSSFSPALLAHARDNALDLVRRCGLGRDSLVVEVASNDGYLLRNFVELGIPALGVDPAPEQARAARQAGVDTVCDFFGLDLARRIAAERGPADVIIASNVLAHVADTNGLVEGFAELLADRGTLVIEVPYARSLVDGDEFDTIYLEHLCYFSVTALDRLFRAHGLFLNDLRRLDIHGGSLRLYVQRRADPAAVVAGHLADEAAVGVTSLPYYLAFAERARANAARLRGVLADLRGAGRRIAAYGAAAKGTTLLNFVGVDHGTIEFVVDRNVHKHGRYTPVTRIPIRPTEHLLERQPDDCLLLTWNFEREILAQQREYLRRGGRFLVPVPAPRFVGAGGAAA